MPGSTSSPPAAAAIDLLADVPAIKVWGLRFKPGMARTG
jgi:hypothetical protein